MMYICRVCTKFSRTLCFRESIVIRCCKMKINILFYRNFEDPIHLYNANIPTYKIIIIRIEFFLTLIALVECKYHQMNTSR